MATTGDGRNGRPGPPRAGAGRRPRLRAAWAAGAAVLVLAVATGVALTAHGARQRPVLAGKVVAGQAAAGRGAAGKVAAAPGRPALTFCQTTPASSLRMELTRTVPGSRRAEIQPLGVSADAREVYVSAWTAGFSGVAELNLATGGLRRIRAFAHPATDQADGSAGGRWLAWAQTYSLSSLDRFTMYAWDSVTGHLLRLGQSLAGPGGTAWPSPWHAPAVSGHYAAWAQGYGPGGLVEIRLADLSTGKVTTIRSGHTQPPFFDGSLVVWPESDTPGTQTTLRAYSLTAGRLVPLPPALRTVHGTAFVVTDGIRTAYLSPGLTQLYYSPRQDQAARLSLQLPAGVSFSDLAMAPGTLAWTTSRATYLASTRSGAFTRVTPSYGYATGSGSVVLVSDAPGRRSAHPVLPLHVIDPAGLTWGACHARTGPAR